MHKDLIEDDEIGYLLIVKVSPPFSPHHHHIHCTCMTILESVKSLEGIFECLLREKHKHSHCVMLFNAKVLIFVILICTFF